MKKDRNKKTTTAKVKVHSQEEYCEMLKQEFSFLPELKTPKNPQKVLQITQPVLSQLNYQRKFKEKQNSGKLHEIRPVTPKVIEVVDHPEYSKKDKNEQVQNFIQKKNMAQGMMDMALGKLSIFSYRK